MAGAREAYALLQLPVTHVGARTHISSPTVTGGHCPAAAGVFVPPPATHHCVHSRSVHRAQPVPKVAWQERQVA